MALGPRMRMNAAGARTPRSHLVECDRWGTLDPSASEAIRPAPSATLLPTQCWPGSRTRGLLSWQFAGSLETAELDGGGRTLTQEMGRCGWRDPDPRLTAWAKDSAAPVGLGACGDCRVGVGFWL